LQRCEFHERVIIRFDYPFRIRNIGEEPFVHRFYFVRQITVHVDDINPDAVAVKRAFRVKLRVDLRLGPASNAVGAALEFVTLK
jgi:hypothetical protein